MQVFFFFTPCVSYCYSSLSISETFLCLAIGNDFSENFVYNIFVFLYKALEIFLKYIFSMFLNYKFLKFDGQRLKKKFDLR